MKPSFKPSTNVLEVPFRRESEAQVFLGVRSICFYMRIGPSTLYTWTRHFSFPATRTPDGRWMTCAALIDNWIQNRLEQGPEAAGEESETAHG